MALGRSKWNSKRGFGHLGGQKAPQTEAKRALNRAQEAMEAQDGETLIFADSTQHFSDFEVPGVPHGGQNRLEMQSGGTS